MEEFEAVLVLEAIADSNIFQQIEQIRTHAQANPDKRFDKFVPLCDAVLQLETEVSKVAPNKEAMDEQPFAADADVEEMKSQDQPMMY